MGRLLKKKDPQLRKKKRAEADSEVSGETTSLRQANSASETVKDPSPRLTTLKKTAGEVHVPDFLTRNRYIGQSIQFLREVKVELKKVVWPTRKQTMGSTAAVIVLVTLISVFLGIVDIGLSSLIHTVLN